MFSFTIVTSTPAVLRDKLIERDVIKEEVVEGPQGNTTILVGVREGLEWVEVPNPLIANLATGSIEANNYVPAVMDNRRCYLVKLVREAHDNEIEGLQQTDTDANTGHQVVRTLLQRTKLGQWVMSNSVADTLDSADGRSYPARRVGTNFWLVANDDFGVWQ